MTTLVVFNVPRIHVVKAVSRLDCEIVLPRDKCILDELFLTRMRFRHYFVTLSRPFLPVYIPAFTKTLSTEG